MGTEKKEFSGVPFQKGKFPTTSQEFQSRVGNSRPPGKPGNSYFDAGTRCFRCGQMGHRKFDCKQKIPQGQDSKHTPYNWRSEAAKKVSRVAAKEEESIVEKQGEPKQNLVQDVRKVSAKMGRVLGPTGSSMEVMEIPVGEQLVVATEQGHQAKILVDSGAEFNCVRQGLLGEEVGKVTLSGFDGRTAVFPVKRLQVRIVETGLEKAGDASLGTSEMICAIVPNLTNEVIVTPDDYVKMNTWRYSEWATDNGKALCEEDTVQKEKPTRPQEVGTQGVSASVGANQIKGKASGETPETGATGEVGGALRVEGSSSNKGQERLMRRLADRRRFLEVIHAARMKRVAGAARRQTTANSKYNRRRT